MDAAAEMGLGGGPKCFAFVQTERIQLCLFIFFLTLYAQFFSCTSKDMLSF